MEDFRQTFGNYIKFLESINADYGVDYLISVDNVNDTVYQTVHIMNKDMKEKYNLNKEETYLADGKNIKNK